MKPDFAQRTAAVADGLALLCLAAMATLPFLHPRHQHPIPSFWSEWWAFAFGLAAAALLLIRPGAWRPMGLPAIVAIPFAFLATALAQYFAGRWFFIESWLLYAAYLLWAALLLLAARSFVARRGLEPLAVVLAAALLAGALANTAAAALQFHHAGYRSGWVFLRIAGVPYSNLGQQNHFNHQLWLGIGSLYYLHLRGRCRLAFAAPALLLLLLAATMSTSKSILLYAFAFTALAGLMRWKCATSAEARRLWRLTLPLLPLVLLLQWGTPLLGIAGDSSLPTASQRLATEPAAFHIRWRLALVAWEAFLRAPLLGNGIGILPWQYFLAGDRFPFGTGPLVAEHAHNLPLQLLAEFGVVPVAIMLWLLGRWSLALLRQSWHAEQWWLVALLSVGAIHSLLEYPLWYAFFLGIAMVLLGAPEQPVVLLNNGRRGAFLCALVLAVGLAPLVSMRLDYARLEQRFNAPPSTSGLAWRETIDDLVNIQRDSLLSPYVMFSLSAMTELNRHELPAKVEVCQQAIKFAPSRRIVFKCAALLALSNEEAAARRLMEQALRAYPREAAKVATDFGREAAKFNELRPLQQLAERYAEQAKSLP